jgi:hypothetical protein
MVMAMSEAEAEPADFFISYAGPDRPWAEWMAWQLSAAGYTVVLDVGLAGRRQLRAPHERRAGRGDRVRRVRLPRHDAGRWVRRNAAVTRRDLTSLVRIPSGATRGSPDVLTRLGETA